MITSLDDLAPQVQAAAEEWVRRLVRGVDAAYRDSVQEDLRDWFTDHLDAESTLADVEALAAAVGDATGDVGERRPFGGLPIDLHPPTAERVAHTWWNPRDERLFVPRVFGLGWTLNMGAAAVKLGLIEPDAEDEPFASTPTPAFRAALVAPVLLTVAVAAHYAFRWRGLPERLPSQLGAAGQVDRWTPKAIAAAVDVSVAAAPTAWAAWQARNGATGATAAGSVAAATASAATAAGLTLWRAAATDGRARPWVGPGLAALLWLPSGAVLLALARAGREAEQRRDLGEPR